ncbi:MAG: hypothetical protein J6X43_03140 [Bacteroidales bacterium]|nr:hypothetical protein [Bacteroidales bacterium]
MAYNEDKDTSNPFLSKINDKWDDFISFEGDSIIEVLVKSIANLIVLLVLVLLIPIGVIISIYNSLYNLQKKAYENVIDDSGTSSQFASSVELGVYILLSLPFFLLLVPYWIIAAIVTWLVKHKVLALIIIVIVGLCYVFRDRMIPFVESLINKLL